MGRIKNMEINIIDISQPWGNCVLCEIDTPLGHSVPMYEGRIVGPEKTDEWAGQIICKKCYDKLEEQQYKRENIKLLYASDYDSQNDISIMHYVDKRKRYHNGEQNGKYAGRYFEAKL